MAAAGAARADGDPARGEKRFEDCVACHSTERGVNNVGPTLYGVFDRKAGEVSDFRYSPALKRSGITWTAQALDAFIADPQKAVPANRMPYAGLAAARTTKARRGLILRVASAGAPAVRARLVEPGFGV